jgi:hypothetical protein
MAAEPSSQPYIPGEKLTFDLTWGGMGAGHAVLQVLPQTTLNGSAAYHFELTARSSNAIDRIFKIRDRLESFTDLKVTHSLLYRQKIREGSYRKNRVITFDWEKNELTYISNNSKPKKVSVMPGTFDPLAAFYFLRLQPLHKLKKVECPITDGKINVIGRANVLRKETIRVGGRAYATVVLEPILDSVELFGNNENAGVLVWMTADERRLPVLVESRVAFGYFRAELRKVEHVSVSKTQ